MGRRRGGASSSSSSGGGGGMFGRKAAPAPSKAQAAPAPPPAQHHAPAAQHHAPPPAQHHAPPPAPMPAAAPAAAPASGGMMSGLGGMVAQGMALGVGSSMGHAAVNGVMGMFSGSDDKPAEAPQQHSAPQQALPQVPSSSYNNIQAGDACAVDQKQLYQCLQEQNNNAAACEFYFQALRACQENQQYQ